MIAKRKFMTVETYIGWPPKRIVSEIETQRIRKEDCGYVYAVFIDNKKIGEIRREMAMFERAPRGSRVVTKRWHSLRWFAHAEPGLCDDARLYKFDCTTIGSAVRVLLSAIETRREAMAGRK